MEETKDRFWEENLVLLDDGLGKKFTVALKEVPGEAAGYPSFKTF